MKTASAFILAAYLFKESLEYIVQYLNIRHMKRCGNKVSPEFEGKIDSDLLSKMQAYENDKTVFSILSSIFGNIITIAFIFGGMLNAFNSFIASLNLSFIVSGWIFFMILAVCSEMLSIPFSLYEHFRIEKKYGFNTMTAGIWVSDFLKSLLISIVLMSVLLPAVFMLVDLSPAHWWLWVWGVMLAYGIFIMYISPYVIEPLFNKFSPLEDVPLKSRILDLAHKAGISVGKVLKMDASRRSRHSNAYFAGIGKTKRIVLFDTLLEGMSEDEIIAVLAHEIGHWKRRHVLKMVVATEIISLLVLYIAYRLMTGDLLAGLFPLDIPTAYAKFLLIGFLAGIAALPLKPAAAYFSRRHEREADKDCLELTGNGGAAAEAFIKLARENLSNLYPHPLYVLLYYSHPPILERIKYIKKSSAASKEALNAV